MRIAPTITVAVAAAALLVGCAQAPGPAGQAATASTLASARVVPQPPLAPPKATPAVGARVVGTVTTGIETPWGIAFLPGNGGAFVGSRDTANIYLVRSGKPTRLVGHISGVVSNGRQGGEAGLLGFALSPRFAVDHQLYIYLSTLRDNRIVRMTWAGGRLGSLRTVLKGIPRGLHHNGGGLGFGPDGMLYASTGESGVKSLAQNLHSLGGKILRLTPAGRVPANNPFRGSYVYSYGHRNVEGFAWDAGKRLWAVEFGDKAYDELNLILPGHNYGWPATQGVTRNPRYTSPKLVWRTDVAGPSSIAIVRGVAWISALTGHRLYRVPLIGTRAGTPRQYLVGTYGRIRKVALAPGGLLWMTTSNTDGRGVPRRGDDRILAVHVS
jgi:glucose/arabinose dehydrogenase